MKGDVLLFSSHLYLWNTLHSRYIHKIYTQRNGIYFMTWSYDEVTFLTCELWTYENISFWVTSSVKRNGVWIIVCIRQDMIKKTIWPNKSLLWLKSSHNYEVRARGFKCRRAYFEKTNSYPCKTQWQITAMCYFSNSHKQKIVTQFCIQSAFQSYILSKYAKKVF